MLYFPLLQHAALMCRKVEVVRIKSDLDVLMASFLSDPFSTGPTGKKDDEIA